MNKEKIQMEALKAENLYMRDNIKKLRNIIRKREKELFLIKNSKGYKLIEKIRKMMFWRRWNEKNSICGRQG